MAANAQQVGLIQIGQHSGRIVGVFSRFAVFLERLDERAAKRRRNVLEHRQHKANELLSKAVLADNAHAVRKALNMGANPGILEGHGGTLLIGVASDKRRNSLRIAKLLIWHGANLEATNDFGWTALSRAAFSGHNEMVKLLLEHGARPDVRSKAGNTIIGLACASGDLKTLLAIERALLALPE